MSRFYFSDPPLKKGESRRLKGIRKKEPQAIDRETAVRAHSTQRGMGKIARLRRGR